MFPVGLLSFPLTPFDEAGELDLGAFSEHLEDQLAQDPDGIFVAAGAGEYAALGLDEYRAVLERSVEIVGGQVPLYAGAGAGPRYAVESVRIAEETGVDGVLLMPPYLVEAPSDGLIAHVTRVAAATRLPIAIYQRANAVFTDRSALHLLDIPNVVALKDGTGDIERLQRIVTAIRTSGHTRAEEFLFQNGQPTAEISALAYRAVGVPGYSSAVLNFAPDIARAFYSAYVAHDLAQVDLVMKSFYLPFARIRDRGQGYAVSLVKAGARLRGLRMGSVRPPLADPVRADIDDLETLLKDARRELAGSPHYPATGGVGVRG